METEPLFGFEWNEAEADADFNKGLLTIVAFDGDQPHAVGVGFVIWSDGKRAIAISAAHVFTEVRRLQSSEPRHSRTALLEFLALPDPVNIDRTKVRAISVADGKPDAFVIQGLVFDERRDLAIFEIVEQDNGAVPLHKFEVTHEVPGVGDIVAVLSYGDLGIDCAERNGAVHAFRLRQRPVLRTGRISAVYPQGQRLCRSFCIETTIPVFSGMSGGPVFAFASVGSMRPFSLVCSDPDPDGDIKRDRHHRGASIMAVLPLYVDAMDAGASKLSLDVPDDSVVGFFSSCLARADENTILDQS